VRVDLPNADGVPNHQPDPLMDPVDNHDTLTGSDKQGRLAGVNATCSDSRPLLPIAHGGGPVAPAYARDGRSTPCALIACPGGEMR